MMTILGGIGIAFIFFVIIAVAILLAVNNSRR